MRILIAGIFSLTAASSLADTSNSETKQPNCQQFAVQQVAEFKQDYYGALTTRETDIVLQTAKRSCLALYNELQSEQKEVPAERAAYQEKPVVTQKTHWWEQREEEGKAIPNIKKAQKQGGK